MSREEIHQMAAADTPAAVQVPNTWHGLLVWATARFGVGILVAAAFAYSTKVVYEDMRSDRERLLLAYEENTRVVETFASKLAELTKSIDDAHRRADSGR